ncbi:MAG: exodeoxyribonuclease VII small subunit [Bacilli bacterium]|jgi:exodeoxyribonuclease VII small subunit
MAAKSKIDFEKNIARLEEIAESIESGKPSLDESIALYEEGKMIIKSLEKALREAEIKVKELDKVE